MRKKRVPEQGISNFSQTQTLPKRIPFKESVKRLSLRNLSSCSPEPKVVPEVKETVLAIQKTKIMSLAHPVSEIRKAFKGKSNIWRIAKAWNFA